jgi:hypothetical protein
MSPLLLAPQGPLALPPAVRSQRRLQTELRCWAALSCKENQNRQPREAGWSGEGEVLGPGESEQGHLFARVREGCR